MLTVWNLELIKRFYMFLRQLLHIQVGLDPRLRRTLSKRNRPSLHSPTLQQLTLFQSALLREPLNSLVLD